MTDEKVEALSDEELEGTSGGKRIEVVTGVKGVWAESTAPTAGFGDTAKAGFGAGGVDCIDPLK